MEEKKLNDFKFEKDDFVLCDRPEIKDSSLDTPPTTFLKDAFRRFLKNKSSVTAAIIIGLLLVCSFLVPVISPYENVNIPSQTRLLPKLFNAGTGFWDGTEQVNNMIYNVETEAPYNTYYQESGIVEGTFSNTNVGDHFVNVPTAGAYGGTLTLTYKEVDSNYTLFRNYHGFTLVNTDNVNLELSFTDMDDMGTKAEYRVVLKYLQNADSDVTSEEVLRGWTTTDYSDLNVNLSQLAIVVSSLYDVQVEIQMKQVGTKTSYLAIDELKITTSNSSKTNFFDELSILDANEKGLMKSSGGIFPDGYWQTTNTLGVKNANISYCSFKYDPYEAAFGDYDTIATESHIETYVANGWCNYDFSIGISSFEILDELCPIVEVIEQKSLPFGNGFIYELKTINSKYKELGYEKMPKFLLGTDEYGRDIITITFDGLKYSLGLAFLVSAICFSFGLLWGSISGYFGGSLDLFLERLRDIIGGVPYLVVMTLVIILLGNNFVTFAMALCLTGWLGVAGRTRIQFYRYKGREYVLASRTLGASDKRLIFKHILPNALGTIITMSILMIPGVIGSETTLSYLGMGIEGVDTLGVILAANQGQISSRPALILFPAGILSLIMISFNLFGNGLRDALNPTLKGSE